MTPTVPTRRVVPLYRPRPCPSTGTRGSGGAADGGAHRTGESGEVAHGFEVRLVEQVDSSIPVAVTAGHADPIDGLASP